ncbi:PAS domain S-box protein [Flavobacterium sp. ZT3R25]|uniref:PAS domain S-box protein n=1 Tax=Flavobacterium galactosi TaxID=3398735 RepID=UPI003A8565FF
MKTKILIVEHDPTDIGLIQHALKIGNLNYIAEIVQTEKDYKKKLRNFKPDIILSNYTLPSFEGTIAFELKEKLLPRTPFIFISESIGEENEVALIKNGATDFVLKERLETLADKINRALKEAAQTKKELIDVKKVMDYSLDVICTGDQQGNFVHISTSSESLWGYKPEELIGKNYIDLVFQADAENTKNSDSDVKIGVPGTMFENRYIHKNGSIAKDPTKKIKLEKAFGVEKQRFQDLFLQAPSCMGILKGPNHVYELTNEHYLHLIGKKNIIGKTVKEVLPELEAQGIFEFLDTVFQTGETFSADEMLVKFDFHGNGKLVDTYLNFICQAHRDINGTIDGIFFFANDVTEQVLSRKKIEESEKRHRSLFENNPVPMWITDLKTFKFLDVNKMAILQYGYSREEFLSMTAIDIRPEEEQESFRQYNKSFEYDPTNFNKGIWNHQKKDGTIFPAEINAHEIIYEGGPARFILSNDITERKKAEESLLQSESRLKDAQAIARLGGWELNFETGIALWSDETCRIYGLSPKDNKQSYSNWISFIHPDDMDNVMTIVNESQRTLSNSVLNNRIILKDGTIKHIDSECRFEFDQNGKPIGLFGIAHDVTEIKLAKLQLEQQNKELAFQNEEKENRTIELSITNKELIKTNTELDRFVYSISHDLRSPLTSILGLISFIEEESKETDTLEHVKMIRNSINRLDEFIKNILSYSRNKRTGLEVEKIPLQKTAADIVDSLHSMKEAKGIVFEIDIKEQQSFYTDRLRFNTILENLISNAIKYHKKEESGRYVKIIGQSDHKKLQLSITDNGIGIAPTYHTKIFDMFFRLSGKKDGSGIGLYIVKDTVGILQGTIQIHSKEGVGTVFIVTLKNLKP